MTRANAIFRWILLNTVLATLSLLCAGRMNLPMLWAFLAIFASVTLVAAFVVDPELLKERSNPGHCGLDPLSGKSIGLLFLATVDVAALDAGRFHWTRSIPHLTHAIALALVAVLLLLQTWAMTVNPFFSSAIRVQTERGHHLITRGPYRVVRHPGYFAMLFSTPATAIALGSTIALVPALLCSIVILRRTIHEDRFLRDQLAGYAGYMLIVRYRLFPGLW
jgi:protein-S-isoprenylcysteine O-methyltransferase Ste14